MVGEKTRVSDAPNVPAPFQPPPARCRAACHHHEPRRDMGTTLQFLKPLQESAGAPKGALG